MINIVDAGSLYLSAKAESQKIYEELEAKWTEPLLAMLPMLITRSIQAMPELDQRLRSEIPGKYNELLAKYGG